MYGTVALCAVRAENVERMIALAAADRIGRVDGFLGVDVLVAENHPDTMLMVARFRDRASYDANADSPEQDAWYQEFRALMEADPVWYDGEWVRLP